MVAATEAAAAAAPAAAAATARYRVRLTADDAGRRALRTFNALVTAVRKGTRRVLYDECSLEVTFNSITWRYFLPGVGQLQVTVPNGDDQGGGLWLLEPEMLDGATDAVLLYDKPGDDGTGWLELRGKASATVPLRNPMADNHPHPLALPESFDCLLLDGQQFATIAAVRTAIARDDTRPALTGVLVSMNRNGMVEAVAADGFRLYITTQQAGADSMELAHDDERTALLSPQTLNVLSAMVKAAGSLAFLPDGMAGPVSGGTCHGAAAYDDTIELLWWGTHVTATFPTYQQLVPKDCKDSFSVSVKELAAALKGLQVKATKGDAGIVRVQVYDGILHLSRTVELDNRPMTHETEAPIIPLTGGDCKIAANIDYLVDMARFFSDEDRIVIETQGPSQPIKIQKYQDVTNQRIAVVMPMFVQW